LPPLVVARRIADVVVVMVLLCLKHQTCSEEAVDDESQSEDRAQERPPRFLVRSLDVLSVSRHGFLAEANCASKRRPPPNRSE
jgi:hypothetical protein